MTPEDLAMKLDAQWLGLLRKLQEVELLDGGAAGVLGAMAADFESMGVEGARACGFGMRDEARRAAREAASRTLTWLVRLAKRIFAPGCALDINEAPLTARWLGGSGYESVEWYFAFSPSRIWGELKAEYGNGSGIRIANEQAADVLVRSFDLAKSRNIKRVGGAVDLAAYVHSSPGYDSRPGRELSYASRESLSNLMAAVKTFLTAAGESEYSSSFRGPVEFRAFCSSGARYESRMTFGVAPLQLVLYYEKLTVRLSHELAASLSEFVGEYSQRLASASQMTD